MEEQEGLAELILVVVVVVTVFVCRLPIHSEGGRTACVANQTKLRIHSFVPDDSSQVQVTVAGRDTSCSKQSNHPQKAIFLLFQASELQQQ